MKCPHCGYKHGWDGDLLAVVDGDNGDFYTLPVKMEREHYGDTRRIKLRGCPSCNKTFIGEE